MLGLILPADQFGLPTISLENGWTDTKMNQAYLEKT